MNQPPQHVAGLNPQRSKEFINPRRWPRFQVHLPVVITAETEVSGMAVPGLVSEMSRRGMAVYAGVHAKPGELMHVDFRTTNPLRLAAIVRNCSGYCFGLEFLAREMDRESKVIPAEDMLAQFVGRHEEYLLNRQTAIERARQQTLKIRRLREEIEMLLRVAQVGE